MSARDESKAYRDEVEGLNKTVRQAWGEDGRAPLLNRRAQKALPSGTRWRQVRAVRAASLLGLAALLLSGCVVRTGYAPPPPEYAWAHSTATESQFRADSAFCNAQASRAVPGLPPAPMMTYPPPPITEQLLDNNRRMNESIRIRLEREDQFNFCMQSFGYFRVRRN